MKLKAAIHTACALGSSLMAVLAAHDGRKEFAWWCAMFAALTAFCATICWIGALQERPRDPAPIPESAKD